MDGFQTVYLDTHELSCPVCHEKYDLSSHYPMSIHCGHTICSPCLDKLRKCPLCHRAIHNKRSGAKNLLLCSLLEQKAGLQECKKHKRYLEFYCQDDHQLICVDCGFKDKHFKHNVIQIHEVDQVVKDTKSLIGKVEQKDEEVKKKYKKFLEEKKLSLKRELDEVIDECIEPLIALKKKLHKEADSFIYKQGEMFDEKLSKNLTNQWKKKNEELVVKWGEGIDGLIATELLNNKYEDMEENVQKGMEINKKSEEVVCNKIGKLRQGFEAEIEFMKQPWKSLLPKIKGILDLHREINPTVEMKYLEEYFIEHGLKVEEGVNKEGEKVFNIQKGAVKEDNRAIVKEKYFECVLTNLKLECAHLAKKDYEVLWGVLENIQGLKELSLGFVDLLDEDVAKLGRTLSFVKSLEDFCLTVDSKLISEKGIHQLWSCIYELAMENLQKVSILMKNSVKSLSNHHQNHHRIKKSVKLKELDLQFINSGYISEEGLGYILNTVKGSPQVTKFSIAISDCHDLQFQPFNEICLTIPTFVNLEEFGFVFEGFYEFGNEDHLLYLSGMISNLNNLQKLKISFARDTCLTEKTILKFFGNLSAKLTTKLVQLSVNLSSCTNISDQTLINFGILVSKFVSLTKLELVLQECSISHIGVSALIRQLKKLSNLDSLFLDCRDCGIVEEQDRILDLLKSSIPRLQEKNILLSASSAANLEQPHQRELRDFFGDDDDYDLEPLELEEPPGSGLIFHGDGRNFQRSVFF